MSLKDRQNQRDGRLESLDRYMTHLGDKLGNTWSARTGFSRSGLTQGLYVLSAWAATQQFTLTHDPFMAAIIAVAVLSWSGRAQSARGGLVEQIQSEAAGLPKNALAAMRLVTIGAGMLQLATAAGDVLGALAGGPLLFDELLSSLFLGSALVALQASDYIKRTNPFTPSGGHRQL